MARRRLDPEERRAEIIDAARRVFAARPYPDVTLADIAEEAGASRALVTHYFGDKNGIFTEVANAFAQQAARTIAVGTGLTGEAIIRSNVDAILRYLADHRETVLALLSGSSSVDLRIGSGVDVLRDAVADRMIANQFPDGDAPPNARFAIRSFTGLFTVAVADWLRHGEPPREQVADFLARTALDLVARLRQDAAAAATA